MASKYVMAYDVDNFNTKVVSAQEIKNIIDDVSTIRFGDNVQINDTNILYTSVNAPLTYTSNSFFVPSKCLNIDKEYYSQNKSAVDNLIQFIIKNKKKDIHISSPDLINENVINAIISNPNLEEVTFGNRHEPYKLDVKTYEKFKLSNIKVIHTDDIVEELKLVQDKRIGYIYEKRVFNFMTLADLLTKNELLIYGNISEKELDNIKYINENAKITLSSDSYPNMFQIIEKLKYYNKKNLIEIKFLKQNKNDFNRILFNNLELINNLNIEASIGYTESLDIDKYISYEMRLYKMIEPAINLSPFERYLYAYNIVKKFKKYKENDDDLSSSRNLYKILDNDYMVCVGYSELLGDLLDKLNIPNRSYDVDVDITHDRVPLDVHVVTEDMLIPYDSGGHARREIHLVDPKYGINGIYIADPTWDNDMEHDAYNHALMTQNEYNGLRRYNYLKFYDIEELFFVNSLEEFYNKANIWMNKQITRFDKKNVEQKCIKYLIDHIKSLDIVWYQSLCQKFPKVSSVLSEYSKNDISDILFEIGNYIVSKVNKMVSGKELKDAIEFLYENCYGVTDYQELQSTINEIMKYNKERQELKFPTRYKQDVYGNEVPYLNITNKFDLDLLENKTK